MIAVIIPYFQRKAGILRPAVESVMAQGYRGRIWLLVIDDGSPVPAESECEGLKKPENVDLRVVVQKNGGVSAARNMGLSNVPDEAHAVAFLDSDDQWTPDHLSRAAAAFAHGADLYFANWQPLGTDKDALAYFGRLPLDRHQRSDWDPDLFVYRGGFFLQELTKPVGRMSTLALRWPMVRDLRFDSRLNTCAEDILFRLHVARRNPAVMFSIKVECRSGEGVNIFSGRRWGTPGLLEVLHDQLLFSRLVEETFNLSAAEREAVEGNRKRVREDAALNVLTCLRARKPIPLALLKKLYRADPRLPLEIPRVVFRRMALGYGEGGSQGLPAG